MVGGLIMGRAPQVLRARARRRAAPPCPPTRWKSMALKAKGRTLLLQSTVPVGRGVALRRATVVQGLMR